MLTVEEQARLYTEYRPKVLGYIRARVKGWQAEDLCQDVFEKAFRAADRYDPAKSAPGTWLYAITRNTVINYLRRTRPTEELPEALSDDARPEDGLMQEALLEELAVALEKLPEELTNIIVLRYHDGLPLTEIAAILGMSYGAVKLRHQKALTLLRTTLKTAV
jgi:RNA polymerase sigma-70 factor (ECF subfamily)